MKDKIRNNLITIIASIAGIAGGFLYWKFVGCASGTCPLTSSWKIMLVYGGVVGGLMGNMVQNIIIKNNTKNIS